MFNPYIKDFPALKQTVNSKRLIYLDNAATTQKPQTVIDALTAYYSQDNANPIEARMHSVYGQQSFMKRRGKPFGNLLERAVQERSCLPKAPQNP